MEIRLLKYFLAVAREENITKAAQVVHVSQPSLSKQLKELEEELGKKLFIRGSRKITLTDDGILFRKRAQEIIDLVNITENEMQENNIAGTIHIGAAETYIMQELATIFKNLRDSYGNIKFDMFNGNQEDVLEKLNRGLIDFGIVIEPKDLSEYNYIKLRGYDTPGIICTLDSPIANKEYIEKKDLEGIPIMISKQVIDNHDYDEILPKNLNILGYYNLIHNVSILVSKGLGCATAIDKLVNTNGTNLKFIPFKNAKKQSSYVIWKKYQVMSKVDNKFIEELKKLKEDE